MPKLKLVNYTVALICIGSFLSFSCGDDENKLTGTIDNASVAEYLNLVQISVPECISNAIADKQAIQTEIERTAEAVKDTLDALAVADIDGEGVYYGNCTDNTGTLTIAQVSHESGVTTLSVSFSDYCTESAAGEKSLLNGDAGYIEHGKPSDEGPIVSEQTGETDSAGLSFVRMSADRAVTSDKTIVLSGYSREYGTPYNAFFGKLPPTEEAPDETKVSNLVVTDNINDFETKVTNLTASVFETVPGSDTTNKVVSVTQGVVSIGDSGTVAMETDSDKPIIINSSKQLTSGAMVMTGATGTATFEINGINTATVEVNGELLVNGTALDCTNLVFSDLFFGQ